MTNLAPSFDVSSELDRNEIHFTAKGLWDEQSLEAFREAMRMEMKPIVERGEKMRFLADLRGFVPQERNVSAAIEHLIDESHKFGNERTALVADSVLTIMQHHRLNKETNLQVFDNKVEAVTWLRT